MFITKQQHKRRDPLTQSIFLSFCTTLIFCTIAIGYQPANDDPYLVVLGIAQDGGFPQAGCHKDCCRNFGDRTPEGTACVAVVDPKTNQRWIFECTPHFPAQLQKLNATFPVESSPGIDGIFLTHAHIGHYAGLVHLGREVMGTSNVPVYVMPRMDQFLRNNGPWSQLVELKIIQLMPLENGKPIQLNERISVTPLTVPHRDEFSETVAYKITGPNRSVLFLPDIDKWSRWETKSEDVIADVGSAYLDATFFDGGELPGRDMAQIPHPFIVESIERFGAMSAELRGRVHFIHLNHTNPALDPTSKAAADIRRAGMSIARTLDREGL